MGAVRSGLLECQVERREMDTYFLDFHSVIALFSSIMNLREGNHTMLQTDSRSRYYKNDDGSPYPNVFLLQVESFECEKLSFIFGNVCLSYKKFNVFSKIS